MNENQEKTLNDIDQNVGWLRLFILIAAALSGMSSCSVVNRINDAHDKLDRIEQRLEKVENENCFKIKFNKL
jgi:hypothetical protein